MAPGSSNSSVQPASSCVYTPAVPADRFQGLPVFNPVEAAAPYTATLYTSQGSIAFQALTAHRLGRRDRPRGVPGAGRHRSERPVSLADPFRSSKRA